MFKRSLPYALGTLTGLMAGFTSPAAAAGQALWSLETEMQACIQSSSAQACRQASALVKALQSNASYAGSSHLCKEEISELGEMVRLLPMRDALPTELMASVADVQQACLPFGF
jgi:hypothetical protein